MRFVLTPRGPFSLDAAASFAEGFPGTAADRPPGELRLAWAVDDDWRTVVAAIRQPGETIRGELDGTPPRPLSRKARRDVERITSLDVDGAGFAAVGGRDPVVGALQRRFPRLRPVLFYTPWEAAAWTIIGHRIRMTQAAAVKQRLSDELGERGAFPSPELLVALREPQRGLTERKVDQLRVVATAALEGQLSRDRLRAMPFEDATEDLQCLPGIGPFSAELILIRGVGDPDALPRHERRLARAVHAAYDLPDNADIAPTAEGWRPYRAWVSLLLRAWLEDETKEIANGRRSTAKPRLDPEEDL